MSCRLAVAVLLSCHMASGAPGLRAEEARLSAGVPGALQVMADLALIDETCRDVVVHWGVGFGFATAQGVADTSILPGGPRRDAFMAILAARRASFGPDELCGPMTQNYAQALPGSVMPSFRRDDLRP